MCVPNVVVYVQQVHSESSKVLYTRLLVIWMGRNFRLACISIIYTCQKLLLFVFRFTMVHHAHSPIQRLALLAYVSKFNYSFVRFFIMHQRNHRLFQALFLHYFMYFSSLMCTQQDERTKWVNNTPLLSPTPGDPPMWWRFWTIQHFIPR